MSDNVQSAMYEILKRIQTDMSDVKTRLGGVETRLGGVEARLGGVETRLGAVETRLDKVENGLHRVRQQNAGILALLTHAARGYDVRLAEFEERVKVVEERVGLTTD